MKPISFEGQTTILAEDQPEYLPLPVLVTSEEYISCWKATLLERLYFLFTGCLWLRQLHCGNLLQPQSVIFWKPF